MAQTKIRGNKQIMDLSITNEQISAIAAIELSKLAEAVTTRIIAGTGVSIDSTGIETGTGEVTISAKTVLNINITDLTEKFALSLFDYLVIEDSEDNFAKKKVSIVTFLSALLTGFFVNGEYSDNTNLVFVDGGVASTIYLANQTLDGGGA